MAESIRIYCKNTMSYFEAPIGSSLSEIYKLCGSPLDYRPMHAQVNNKTEGLNYRCWMSKDVEFVDCTQSSGMRTYVRSLSFIFSKAVHDILPDATFNLEHSVSNGYYCVIHNCNINEDIVARIKEQMKKLIKADLPFKQKYIRTEEAIKMFSKQGMDDKSILLETVGMAYTPYYELDGYENYFYGCLTPSTGYINIFDIEPYFEGLLLRVPDQNNPGVLAKFIRQDKMFNVFKEHLKLLKALDLENVGDLNKAIREGRTADLIMISEAMQEKQVAKIAEEIANRYDDGVRIVLISGPSSSGKTTFCKRLQIQLATNFLRPIGLSLDDYFVNREDTPKDSKS